MVSVSKYIHMYIETITIIVDNKNVHTRYLIKSSRKANKMNTCVSLFSYYCNFSRLRVTLP